MKDWLRNWRYTIALVAIVLPLITLIIIGIWARVAAPCDKIDWMPIRDLPGRCLPGLTGGHR